MLAPDSPRPDCLRNVSDPALSQDVTQQRRWRLCSSGRWRIALTDFAVSVIVLTVVALSHSKFADATEVVFSLDNRPQVPVSIDPDGFGNGAEDPFGLVAFPTLVGPSPSLTTFSEQLLRQLSDGDLLGADTGTLLVDTARPLDTNYVNAVSGILPPLNGTALKLAFSVDRASQGAPGTTVHDQFLLNQHPGDIFLTEREFLDPGNFVGTLSGSGWVGMLSSVGSMEGNRLLIDESHLSLTAGNGPGIYLDETSPSPPIAAGSHDNLDAFHVARFDVTGDVVADNLVYFSVNPDQPGLLGATAGSAADIYITGIGTNVPSLFASALQMGLDTFAANSDDVDALVVFDRGQIGVVDPQLDYALFSLGPGSETLFRMYPNLTAADIFFTDFNNAFATFAGDLDLGLEGTVDPAEGIGEGQLVADGRVKSHGSTGHDNVDALGVYPLGDMDWSGYLDTADVDDFVQGVTRPSDYRDSFDHFGQPAATLGDFSIPRDGLVDFDDIPPFRMVLQASVESVVPFSVPEPSGCHLMMAWMLGLASFSMRPFYHAATV